MRNRQTGLAREDVVMLVMLTACVGAWFLPDQYLGTLFGILAIGVMFDLISLVAHTLTLITGHYSSGFPLVGLLVYGWFILAYRKSLVAPQESSLSSILLYKVLDVLVLCGFHLLCQLPMFFQGPRDKYK
jgi:hypothetical protein